MEERETTNAPETEEVPDLGFEPKRRSGKKRKKSRVRRIVLWSVLGILLAALIGGAGPGGLRRTYPTYVDPSDQC